MSIDINDIVILSVARTPMGAFGRSLRYVPVFDLGSAVIKAALERADIEPSAVDEVILGNCRQAGNGPNPARTASVNAGIPESVPVQTLNMACPSGMKAVHLAAQSLMLGETEIAVAGGMDSMSTIPYLLKDARWQGLRFGDKTLHDGWSDSIDPLTEESMGLSAENLVDRYKLERKDLDDYAAESQRRAALAREQGFFNDEITPFDVPASDKETGFTLDMDETIRDEVDFWKMTKLRPAFRENGSVTAGNSCAMGDGAAAMVVTTRHKASEMGAAPLFSLVAFAQAAVEPSLMGEGPGVVIPLALDKAGMTLGDMDLLEVNEAFAAQMLVNERQLGWDREKVNVHGGSIALGHPTGTSGCRIMVTGYQALKRRGGELLCSAICGAGGVTTAIIIRRES